jgi:SAM-dependent methyltransferase
MGSISKLNGKNFNVHKMTKEEIAQKFDNHAPHWFGSAYSTKSFFFFFFFFFFVCLILSFRKQFVSICKYSIFEWLSVQCTLLKRKSSFRSLGIDNGIHSAFELISPDLGCGPGLIGTHLRNNGIDGTIVALDISPKMLELALQTKDSNGNMVYFSWDLFF